MAKIRHLSEEVIKGFAGHIDFYYWRGVPVCRRWPRRTKASFTPAQKESQRRFAQSRSDLRAVEASVRNLWPTDFTGRKQAWLDYYTAMYLRYWKLNGEAPPVVTSTSYEFFI